MLSKTSITQAEEAIIRHFPVPEGEEDHIFAVITIGDEEYEVEIEIILDNTPVSRSRATNWRHKVNESVVDITGKNGLSTTRKLSATQVKKALSTLTGKHFAHQYKTFSLIRFDSKGMTHARTNPPGDVTVVRGHMYYARPNPTAKKDFKRKWMRCSLTTLTSFHQVYGTKQRRAMNACVKVLLLWRIIRVEEGRAHHRRVFSLCRKSNQQGSQRSHNVLSHYPAKDEPSLTSAMTFSFILTFTLPMVSKASTLS